MIIVTDSLDALDVACMLATVWSGFTGGGEGGVALVGDNAANVWDAAIALAARSAADVAS